MEFSGVVKALNVKCGLINTNEYEPVIEDVDIVFQVENTYDDSEHLLPETKSTISIEEV